MKDDNVKITHKKFEIALPVTFGYKARNGVNEYPRTDRNTTLEYIFSSYSLTTIEIDKK